jgi:hypothetical protein
MCDQDKFWAPQICSCKCATNLSFLRVPSRCAQITWSMTGGIFSQAQHLIRSRNSERIYHRFRRRGRRQFDLGFPEPPASTEPPFSHSRSSVPQPHTLAQDELNDLTFCWPCIIMYHNNVTNLIHFHFQKHFIVSKSSTCFRRQASIFRRHYTNSFWWELRAILSVGWLQVVGRKPATLVPPENDAWRPKHVEDYDTIQCLWKWKCIKLVTVLLWTKPGFLKLFSSGDHFY